MQHNTLTSVDYAIILRSIAYRLHNVTLNNTQTNKLLYMCYGLYLAKTSERLFNEQPRAWAYGPVFPSVHKSFNRYHPLFPINKDKVNVFATNNKAVHIVRTVVNNFCHISTYNLTLWSQKPGGSWNITAYGPKGNNKPIWNKIIDDSLIKMNFATNQD